MKCICPDPLPKMESIESQIARCTFSLSIGVNGVVSNSVAAPKPNSPWLQTPYGHVELVRTEKCYVGTFFAPEGNYVGFKEFRQRTVFSSLLCYDRRFYRVVVLSDAA